MQNFLWENKLDWLKQQPKKKHSQLQLHWTVSVDEHILFGQLVPLQPH